MGKVYIACVSGLHSFASVHCNPCIPKGCWLLQDSHAVMGFFCGVQRGRLLPCEARTHSAVWTSDYGAKARTSHSTCGSKPFLFSTMFAASLDNLQGGLQNVPMARGSLSNPPAQQHQQQSGANSRNIGSQSFAVIHAENGTGEQEDMVRVVALRDINFTVPQGSLAAVVGPVGSGKYGQD